MEVVKIEPKLIKIRVKDADVFLEDYEHGQGKITISSYEKGAFTFYWGSMGSNIKDFLISINADYFAGKLSSESYEFDPKGSVKNVRKYIREEMRWDLPHYIFMSAQKEMREKIKELEHCSSKDEFVTMMMTIPDDLICYDLNYSKEREFKSIIEDVFKCEPWNFIAEKTSREYNWLCGFHTELKNILSD